MTTTSELRRLAALTAREVATGALSGLAGALPAIVVDEVTVRLGQPTPVGAHEEPAGLLVASPADGSAEDDRSATVDEIDQLLTRTPWQVELRLPVGTALAGGGQPDQESDDDRPSDVAGTGQAAALATRPVRVVRGVGTRWAERLADVDVTTVGELADAGASLLPDASLDDRVEIAALAGRARTALVALAAAEDAPKGPTVLSVLTDPDAASPRHHAAAELAACLDADALAALRLPR